MDSIPKLRFNMSKFQPKLIRVKKPRSNFNLSRVNRFSASPMLVIPVAWEEVLPDDTFITEYISRITTDSLLSPCLGSFKVSIHEFFAPLRLYSYSLDRNIVNRANATWDRNLSLPRLVIPPLNESVEDFVTEGSTAESIKAGLVLFNKYVEDNQVKSSSLSDYLGLPAGFVNMTNDDIVLSGAPYLTYYDIVRNYFVHPQSGYARFISSQVSSVNTAFNAGVYEVPLANLDYWVSDARNVDGYVLGSDRNFTFSHSGGPFDGLACVTFFPDQFTNFLSSSMLNDIRQLARIDVEESSGESYITVDSLRFANKLTRYLELSLLGGNSKYSDWLHANWGVTINQGIVKPEYLGTTTSWVRFGEVISTSNTKSDDGENITGLGDRGGVGFGRGNGRKRRFNFKENGYYMAVMTIVPEIDYSQGIRKSLLKPYFSDMYVESLDGIGFQKIAYSEVNALPQISSTFVTTADTGEPISGNIYSTQNVALITASQANPFSISIGEQPAWMEYMTAQNELHGRLAYGGDLSYWAIQRNFFVLGPYSDPESQIAGQRNSQNYQWSPYGSPWDFNYLFNTTDPYAQSFICEIKSNIIAKRQKSKNIRPTL